MKLHILSDLHLSQGELALPTTDADAVILAGDIARPQQAVAWMSRIDRPVLYVPGNHEFYGGSIRGRLAELKTLCAGSHIHALHNDALVLDGVRFLGTTLWTDFMLFGDGPVREAAIERATREILDFRRIRRDDDPDAPFLPADAEALFGEAAAWLRQRLAEPWSGPTVIVTHHAPSPRSIHPRFEGSLINACFVSEAASLLDGAPVQLWVHGHTHDSFDYMLGRTRVVCNPRGYIKQGVQENPRFDAGFVVEIGREEPSNGSAP